MTDIAAEDLGSLPPPDSYTADSLGELLAEVEEYQPALQRALVEHTPRVRAEVLLTALEIVATRLRDKVADRDPERAVSLEEACAWLVDAWQGRHDPETQRLERQLAAWAASASADLEVGEVGDAFVEGDDE